MTNPKNQMRESAFEENLIWIKKWLSGGDRGLQTGMHMALDQLVDRYDNQAGIINGLRATAETLLQTKGYIEERIKIIEQKLTDESEAHDETREEGKRQEKLAEVFRAQADKFSAALDDEWKTNDCMEVEYTTPVRIKKGDIVNIHYLNGVLYKCKVTHTSRGAGDMWQFLHTTTGDIIAQNPYSPFLDGFVLESKKE